MLHKVGALVRPARGLHVFISYPHAREAEAQALRRHMADHGATRCWVASREFNGGERIADAIAHEVAREKFDLFFVLWDEHAAESQWVSWEVGLARAHKETRIVRVSLGPEPVDKLPGFFDGELAIPMPRTADDPKLIRLLRTTDRRRWRACTRNTARLLAAGALIGLGAMTMIGAVLSPPPLLERGTVVPLDIENLGPGARSDFTATDGELSGAAWLDDDTLVLLPQLPWMVCENSPQGPGGDCLLTLEREDIARAIACGFPDTRGLADFALGATLTPNAIALRCTLAEQEVPCRIGISEAMRATLNLGTASTPFDGFEAIAIQRDHVAVTVEAELEASSVRGGVITGRVTRNSEGTQEIVLAIESLYLWTPVGSGNSGR